MFQVGCPVQGTGMDTGGLPRGGQEPLAGFLCPLPPALDGLSPASHLCPGSLMARLGGEGGPKGTRAPLHLPERCG